MFKDLKAQIDVIKALAIHDLSGQMKTLNYGYVWLILEPMIFIGFMRLARSAFKVLAPPDGMTPLAFFTIGVMPTFMSFQLINKVFSIVGSPSGMLKFPNVTPVDMALASACSIFCTYFMLFWVFLIPVSIYEGSWPPRNLFGVMMAFIGIFLLSVALGFVLSAAYRVFPLMTKFWTMVQRGLRMVSGMFFVITMLPTSVWPYLTWNPLLHLTELFRQYWFMSYNSPIASPMFVVECTLVILLLGLSLEKFMRRVPYI